MCSVSVRSLMFFFSLRLALQERNFLKQSVTSYTMKINVAYDVCSLRVYPV